MNNKLIVNTAIDLVNDCQMFGITFRMDFLMTDKNVLTQEEIEALLKSFNESSYECEQNSDIHETDFIKSHKKAKNIKKTSVNNKIEHAEGSKN